MASSHSDLWLHRMQEQAQSALNAQGTSWSNADHSVRQAQAKLEELGEGVEIRRTATLASPSAQRLKDEVTAAISDRRFGELNRRKLRIAASLLFEIPTTTLTQLIAARPEIHPMLLEAFCNQWTDRRGHPRRRELAALVMAAPKGSRLLHGSLAVDLRNDDAPVRLIDSLARSSPFDLGTVLRVLRDDLECRLGWQFTTEAIAAFVGRLVDYRLALSLWSQLEHHPRAAMPLMPALRENRRWFEQWPPGGGTAPLRTQVSVVGALLRSFVDQPNAIGEAFIDKLLRFSTFGDPRVLPLSQHWRELKMKDSQLFNAFSSLLVKQDLALFFQHAMRDKDREEFWLSYLGDIRRTIPVLAKETRRELARRLRGTEQGRGVVERTRMISRGHISAFCLIFDRVAVVEFSDTGNAAYFYPRDVFEREVLPERGTIGEAKDLKRTDLRHERLSHQTRWQIKAAQMLRNYGVSWPGAA